MMVKTHQQTTKVIYEMEGSIQIKLAKISKKQNLKGKERTNTPKSNKNRQKSTLKKKMEKNMMLKTHQHVGE